MERLGMAIVGIGRWGIRLRDAFAAIADVRAQVTRSSNITLAAALADPGIRAVAIATPIGTHAEIARAALEADKHVFLEKPGTGSEDELAGLMELAGRRGLVLRIGYLFLHHPAFKALETLLASDPVTELRTDWHKVGTFDSPIGLNLLSHELSIACRLLGEPERADVVEKAGVVTACDLVTARLAWPDGQTAELRVNRTSPERHKAVSVRTASGRWYVWSGDDLWELNRRTGTFIPGQLPPGSALAAECLSFVEACGSGLTARDEVPLQVHRMLSRIGV